MAPMNTLPTPSPAGEAVEGAKVTAVPAVPNSAPAKITLITESGVPFVVALFTKQS